MNQHIVRFERGHDCIRFECINGSKRCVPGGGGSHGVHGLTIRFVSMGDDGAVQFTLYTGWLPQFEGTDHIGYRSIIEWGSKGIRPMPADLGYHSKAPRYAGHEATSESCEFTGGGPCYYDGSGLNANDAMYALVNGGDDALWAFLDGYYDNVFKGAPYPEPAEYPRKLRGC